MGRLKPSDILKRVKEEGFEKVWLESAKLLPKRGRKLKLISGQRGKAHPIFEIVQKLRQGFLDLGFIEVLNPVIVEEEEVYKQYGPEAPIILDRCYYLASLPRPDIGLSKEKCQKIELLGVPLGEDKVNRLQGILRGYKRGEISADDLVEEITKALETTDMKAMEVVSEVFPEFATLKPRTSTLTLRSHMTSAWFETLKALQHKLELPIKLFSVDVRFRREQSEDSTHLRTHRGASCVVMGEEVTINEGKRITRTILEPFILRKVRFVKKKVSSRYYAPGSEYEGFVYSSRAKKWIEVVDLGFYSPIALAHYGIEYPVLNIGIGVERLGMILYGESDVRKLAYPQFYAEWVLSDRELAEMVEVAEKPKTAWGKGIQKAIIKTAMEKADQPSPCEFVAYDKKVFGHEVKVWLYETDVGTKLLGPAALNVIYVYKGNVLGMPERGMDGVQMIRDAKKKGFSTKVRYLDAVAALVAAKIEDAARRGKPKKIYVRVRMVKHPSDVNIRLSDVAQRYITSKNLKIDFRGPVFIGVKAEIA